MSIVLLARNKIIPHLLLLLLFIIVLVRGRGENQKKIIITPCFYFCTLLLFITTHALPGKVCSQFKTITTIDKTVLTYPFVKILYYNNNNIIIYSTTLNSIVIFIGIINLDTAHN